MELIPSIDLLDGKVVRLQRGDYSRVTVYSDDPVQQARRFSEQGARRLHVVDLDGARSGRPGNLQHIDAIVRATPLSVQVAGGIRDAETARCWYDAGAERVVFGTAAIEQPAMVQQVCESHPSRVIVAIDARGTRVAIEGWLKDSHREVLELARQVDAWDLAAILHTVIDRDGMTGGPDVTATLRLQREVRASVIASGGIGTLEHVRALSHAGVRAAVCGRALYNGAFTLPEALAAADEAA